MFRPKSYSMTLSQAEIILLNTVAFEPEFLYDIGHPRSLYSAEQLIEALLELQSKGLIVAVDESSSRKTQNDPIPFVSLTKDLIESQFCIGDEVCEAMKKNVRVNWSAVMKKANITYRLTSLGGEMWESLTSPQWDKFVHYSLQVLEDADAEPEEHCRGHLVAATKETLENYINWTLRWGNNSCPDRYLESVTFGRVIKISSWKPLYWKTLPEGFECSMEVFAIHYQSPDEEDKDDQTTTQAERDEMEEYERYFTWYFGDDAIISNAREQ